MESSSCIFCQIVKKQAPAKIIYEDDEVLAFHDINPQAPIHILIVPKKHIPNLLALSPKDTSLIGKIYLAAVKIAKEKKLQEGFRIVTNSGKLAGQTVYHLHFHFLAGRRLGWPPG